MIDTGFDFKGKWSIQPKLCATGHKDFSGYGLQDANGHGTHIAGLIAKYAGDADYCLIIVKYFHSDKALGQDFNKYLAALDYAIDLNVDILNLSLSGTEFMSEEYKAIKKALNASIVVVAAAGNKGHNLTKQKSYPALCDDRVVVVGAIDANADRIPASNYGPQVDVYEQGKNVLSIFPNNSYSYLSGTSQATAIHTGKIVKRLDKTKKLYDIVDPKYLKRRTSKVA